MTDYAAALGGARVADLGAFTISAASDEGLLRAHNEDAFVVANARTGEPFDVRHEATADLGAQPVLLAVADGMGGESAGEVASALTISTLCTTLATNFAHGDLGGALRSAVDRAHRVVCESATGSQAGMGSTLVAVLIDGTRAVIASVGDSRVYLLRGGTLRQLTKDQSMLQSLVDAGSITDEEIAAYPYKSVILQAIGRAPSPSLDFALVEVELCSGDDLLLCSDGLTNELVAEGITRILLRAERPRDAAARLVEAALECGGRDNVTVIVARVDDCSVTV